MIKVVGFLILLAWQVSCYLSESLISKYSAEYLTYGPLPDAPSPDLPVNITVLGLMLCRNNQPFLNTTLSISFASWNSSLPYCLY